MRVSRRVVLYIVLGVLLAVASAAALLTARPDQTITIDIGSEAGLNAQGQGDHLYNFFGWGNPGTEKGRLARRIDPTASFMVPWAFNLGPRLGVDIKMCGCGSSAPVRLLINGTPHTVPLSEEWETYSFTVAHEPTMYNRSLYLEWQSNASPRPLVAQVVVQPAHGSYTATTVPAVPWLVVVLVVALAADARGGALSEHKHDSQLYIKVVWATVLVGSAFAARLLYAPQLMPFAALLALGSIAAVALTLLVREWWRRLLLWLLVLWLLAVPQLLGTWVLDDAFISFRYARNLVEGHGLTFNPGGELVEGYTNFLWTIIMAGVLALGLEPVLSAQVLTSGLALAMLIVIYKLAESWWPDYPSLALLPPLLLALNPSFLLYTARGSGMEAALVTLLTLVALWLVWRADTLRRGLLAGVGCALLVMARPDGALVPLAGGLWLGVLALRQGWKAPPALALAGLVLGFVALYGPYFAWRYSYYGYLLPNTFYAKTGATMAQVQRGFAYTQSFVQSLGLRSLLVLLGLSIVGLIRGWIGHNTRPGPAPLLWLVVLLTGLYVTLVGGDHFPLWRFFVPVVPPLVLLVTHGVAEAVDLYTLTRRRWTDIRRYVAYLPPAAALLALVLLMYVNVSPLPSQDSRDPSGRIWGENRVTLKNREIGWWFARNTPPDTVVATAIAGAMPYYGERFVIDTLGLNNVYIAHLEVDTMGQGIAGAEKTDLQYVLDQQPDYIPFSTSGPYQELERFQQHYELVRVRGPEGGEIELYQRRSEPGE